MQKCWENKTQLSRSHTAVNVRTTSVSHTEEAPPKAGGAPEFERTLVPGETQKQRMYLWGKRYIVRHFPAESDSPGTMSERGVCTYPVAFPVLPRTQHVIAQQPTRSVGAITAPADNVSLMGRLSCFSPSSPYLPHIATLSSDGFHVGAVLVILALFGDAYKG